MIENFQTFILDKYLRQNRLIPCLKSHCNLHTARPCNFDLIYVILIAAAPSTSLRHTYSLAANLFSYVSDYFHYKREEYGEV